MLAMARRLQNQSMELRIPNFLRACHHSVKKICLDAVKEDNNYVKIVRNHVKLLHVYKSRRGFSKGTVLCGGYYSYGLGRSLGHFRPALPKGQKY